MLNFVLIAAVDYLVFIIGDKHELRNPSIRGNQINTM